MSRLLSGKRGGTEVDVSAFLAVCGVIGQERDRLLELCRQMSTRGWLQQHGDKLPKQLRTLMDHEDVAVRIDEFQPIVVPGLLQTGDYARALLAEVALDEGQSKELIAKIAVEQYADPEGDDEPG